MLADAVWAYLHFTAILVLASAAGAEALLLRADVGPRTVRALARADLLYGVSAVAALLTGLLRLFLGPKGAAFYLGNPAFWTKMALFAVIAVLSIAPTVRIVRWRRLLKSDPSWVPTGPEVDATRRLVFWELHLLALVPLAAVLMARAIGN